MEPLSSSQKIDLVYAVGPVSDRETSKKGGVYSEPFLEDSGESMLANVRRRPKRQVSEDLIRNLADSSTPTDRSIETSTERMVGAYMAAAIAASLEDSGEQVAPKEGENPAAGAYVVVDVPDRDKSEAEKTPYRAKRKRIRGRIPSEKPEMTRGEKVKVSHQKNLGEGGFGLVWLGKLQKSEDNMSEIVSAKKHRKKVAVKEFKHVEDRELAVVDALMTDKPKEVARLYGVLKYKDNKHLVMKYCNRGTLSNYFDEHLDNKSKCYMKLSKVMDSVGAFHEAGYCHRDIHERNFLRHRKKNGSEQIYLSDFGHTTKVTAAEGSLPPIGKMGVLFWNSPLTLNRLHTSAREAAEKHKGLKDEKDFRAYNQWLDANPKKVDIHQAGMMIFRVATATGFEVRPPQRNFEQQHLVKHIKALEEKEGITEQEIRSQIRKYLRANHKDLDHALVKLLADMFSPTKSVSMKKVSAVLKEVAERSKKA